MTFKHKLSRRLALLRGLAVATALIAVACSEHSLSDPDVEVLNPSASLTITFNAGDRVQTTGRANVRSGPYGSSRRLGSQPAGALGTIVSGPVVDATGDRLTRFNVNFDNAPDGWIAQQYAGLVLVAPAPPPPPAPLPPSVASVTVNPQATSLVVSATTQLAATAQDSAGNALTGQSITWSTSGTSVATVSSGGLVTAAAAGTAQITATAGGKSGAASITVTAPAAPPPPPTATQLVFTTQPVSSTAGAGFTVAVAAKDAQGNTVSTYVGPIAVAITGGTGKAGAHLGGTTSVASVAGVATFSGLSVDSVGNGYTLTGSASGLTSATSSAFNIAAAGASDEPSDPGSGYLWADNFDRYASVASMDAGGCVSGDEGFNVNPGNQSGFARYGQMTDAGVNTVQEACNPTSTHPEFALITGRSGSGKAVRSNVRGGIGETGVIWRSPNNPRSIGNYTGKLVMQYWFRLSPGAPVGVVGYKWFMMWYKNDPNSSRVEIGIVGGPSARWSPNSGMFDGNSAPFGYQPVGPYWDHTPSGQPAQVNDGQWHRWTVMYFPNTSYVAGGLPSSSRDGIIRVWIDGIRIIDVSASGVAAGRSTNVDLDKIAPFQIDHFTFPGTLNDPPSNFTIDMDDLKVWTTP